MGSSCSCNNILEYKEELDALKEKKQNIDFFIDYSIDNIKQKENIEYDNKILRKIPTNSVSSNNNDLELFSTQNYTNIYNNPIIRNDFYGNGSEEKIIEKDKNKEKDIIIEQKKENENEDEKQIFQTQIKLKPNKKIVLNKYVNVNEDENNNGNYGNFITKNKVIYSCSTDIITKKKYNDDIINEEEYNFIPNDNYSQIIFEQINKLRKNPKAIAEIIEDNKKFIIIDENNRIYFKKNSIRYKLEKGIQIFDETIHILNDLEPMNQLIYNKNIAIKIPENNEDFVNNSDYLKNQIEELQNNGNHISSYWSEKIKDPDIAFLMMVIDDNYIEPGLKRKDLINPDIKFIGIISSKNDNNFICYITLSTRK